MEISDHDVGFARRQIGRQLTDLRNCDDRDGVDVHAEALLADVMQRYGIAADGLTCPHMRGLAEAIAKARGTPC